MESAATTWERQIESALITSPRRSEHPAELRPNVGGVLDEVGHEVGSPLTSPGGASLASPALASPALASPAVAAGPLRRGLERGVTLTGLTAALESVDSPQNL